MKGKVKFFNKKKGFGFIQGDDEQDYFVHFTALPRGVFLRENDEVEFEISETDRGKQAQNVILKKKASESQGQQSADNEQSEESFGDDTDKAEESEEEF